MKDLLRFTLSAALFLPLACGDDDDSDPDDSAGDTDMSGSGNSGNSGNSDSNSGNAQTSSSMETCQSSHDCINDVCTCQTPGLEDMPCTDDDACAEECEICM